jgi:hypothetical protein
VIGPGWLPRYRPRGLSPLRRTRAYTRRRTSARTKNQAPRTRPVNTEIVLFDHGPAELPVAAVRPRQARARVIALVAAFQHWLVAQWRWFRPRTLPCAVAALGMLAMVASADYLAHFKGEHHQVARPAHIELAPR